MSAPARTPAISQHPSGEPGIAFCRQVPGEAKPRCCQMIGARLTLAHPDPEPVRAACRQVEPACVRACLAGAGMRES